MDPQLYAALDLARLTYAVLEMVLVRVVPLYGRPSVVAATHDSSLPFILEAPAQVARVVDGSAPHSLDTVPVVLHGGRVAQEGIPAAGECWIMLDPLKISLNNPSVSYTHVHRAKLGQN